MLFINENFNLTPNLAHNPHAQQRGHDVAPTKPKQIHTEQIYGSFKYRCGEQLAKSHLRLLHQLPQVGIQESSSNKMNHESFQLY